METGAQARTEASKQSMIVTQLLLRRFSGAGDERSRVRAFRRMLIFWLGHDYRLALAAATTANVLRQHPAQSPALLDRTARRTLSLLRTSAIQAAAHAGFEILGPKEGSAGRALLPKALVSLVDQLVGVARGGEFAELSAEVPVLAQQNAVYLTAQLALLTGARDIYDRILKKWAEKEIAYRGEADILLLAEPFGGPIGHFPVTLALWQACEDGLLPQSKIHLTPDQKPSNPYLRSRIEFANSEAGVAGYPESLNSLQMYRCTDGSFLMLPELMDRSFNSWAQGEGLLSLDPSTQAKGDAFLADIGFAPDRPFVTLHVRQHDHGKGARSTVRDCDIQTYLPAIQTLVAEGYSVVRLGDPSMTRLPDMPGVFDYAHFADRQDWLDIYFAANCHFHIGSSSGMSYVPILFNRPTLFTNMQMMGVIGSPLVSTIFKRLRRIDGSHVPFSDIAKLCRFAQNEADYETMSIYSEDNSADEILQAVRYMLHKVEHGVTEVEAARLSKLHLIFQKHGWNITPDIPGFFWESCFPELSLDGD